MEENDIEPDYIETIVPLGFIFGATLYALFDINPFGFALIFTFVAGTICALKNK